MVVTVLGYLLTFLFIGLGQSNEVIKYIYLGFILMMCLNAIFPHLVATIILKKYAPGTFTGLFLNLPIGLYVVFGIYGNKLELSKLILGFGTITIITLLALRPLFKLGKKLIDEY